MCFLNISHEAETYEFPKTWDKWILMLRENYDKVMDFLHISRKAEIHTIAKPWDEWILILRNKYGKTQTIPRGFSTLQI